jgi:SAM-dependent methyltransferase
MNDVPKHEETWQTGLQHELEFWDNWLARKGLQWSDEYQQRLDPNLAISDYYCQFLQNIPRDTIEILDAGAGPLTNLGKKYPGKQLNIVPTDALAREYNRLLDRHGVSPPIRTIYCKMEELDRQFKPESFDLVNARNCVDHSLNPLEAIKQMLIVTRSGGWVALNHAQNEAERQQYVGLHQWNFTVQGNHLIVWSKHKDIDVTQTLSYMGVFGCCLLSEQVQVHVHKH